MAQGDCPGKNVTKNLEKAQKNSSSGRDRKDAGSGAVRLGLSPTGISSRTSRGKSVAKGRGEGLPG